MESLEQKLKNLLHERDKIDFSLKREYGNIFKSGNAIADFGKYFVADRLGLNLMAASNHKGYDAIGKQDGKKYKVKTRKSGEYYGPQFMFPISESGLKNCDYIIFVGLNSDWSVAFMANIPSGEVKPNEHNIFYIKKEFLDKYGVKLDTRLFPKE